jgi:hypothetical protein
MVSQDVQRANHVLMETTDHDLESFIWCLIWTVHRYNNGKLADDRGRMFIGWAHRSRISASDAKLAYTRAPVIEPTTSHKCLDGPIRSVLEAFIIQQNMISLAVVTRRAVPPMSPPLRVDILSRLAPELPPPIRSLFVETDISKVVVPDVSKNMVPDIAKDRSRVLACGSPVWKALVRRGLFGRGGI